MGKQWMKSCARLAYETIMVIIMSAPRAATMLFVLDVRNACSHIRSRLPEEFQQFMNLAKTIFSAIAAPNNACKRNHFSGIVINASGIAALNACQLLTGKLITTLNFFCWKVMWKSWLPSSILINWRNLLEQWRKFLRGNQIWGSHISLRSRLANCRKERAWTILISMLTHQKWMILRIFWPIQSLPFSTCLSKWTRMVIYLKHFKNWMRSSPQTSPLVLPILLKKTITSQEWPNPNES